MIRPLLRLPDLPVLALLALGSGLFVTHAPAAVAVLMALLLAGVLLLRLVRFAPRPRRIGAAVLALALALAGVMVLPWASTGFATLMIATAAWAKLAEAQGRRDRFGALLAGLWLIALDLLAMPSTPAIAVLALTFALVLLALRRDARQAGHAVPLRLAGWAGLVIPAATAAALLFLFTPRLTGNLGSLAFALGLPFVIETEAEAAREPPAERAGLEEFKGAATPEMRVLVAEFQTGTGPIEKTTPPIEELYWRGPVYWTYEDGIWQARPGFERRAMRLNSKLSGAELEAQIRDVTRVSQYKVTVFPNRGPWLFGLDLPAFTPPSAYLTEDWQLMNLNPVRGMLSYDMLAYVEYRAGVAPDAKTRAMALQLPQDEEPRTLALGRQLRAEHGPDPVAIARAGRDLFARGFTLDPKAGPVTGRDPIDRFLFGSKTGYGVHFATAYALMMRAAGVPARVVSGYHGGLYMFLIERVYVTESNAHTWVEIWLDDYGWVRMDVTRDADPIPADPVAAPVAEAQSDAGAAAGADPGADPGAGSEGAGAAGVAAAGGDWLAGFDAAWQARLLQAGGLRASATVLMAVGAGLALASLAVWLGLSRGAAALRRALRTRRLPEAERLAARFLRRLAAFGPVRTQSEGLRAYAARVLATGRPDDAQAIAIIDATEWLCAALYGPATDLAPGPAPAVLHRLAALSPRPERRAAKSPTKKLG